MLPTVYNGVYWYKIPGYEYWVSADGDVCNRMGHILKKLYTAEGIRVELYRCGQREKHLVVDLMRKAGIEVEIDGCIPNCYKGAETSSKSNS